MSKQSIVLSTAIAGVLSSGMAFAEITSNIGVTSTYMWRGFNLSGAQPAISGGVDYAHESGLYAGIWTSSEGDAGVGAGTPETDYYAGFSGEAGDISYDIGFVKYTYSEVTALDFSEAYVAVGYGPVSFGYNAGQDAALDYMSVSFEHDIFAITYGDYDTTSHIDLSATVGDVTLTYVLPKDIGAEDPIMVVSWGAEFSL